jgi:hypothetical protein
VRRFVALPKVMALAAAGVVGLCGAGAVGAATPGQWAGKWSRPAAEIGGTGGVTTIAQTGQRVTGSFNWGGGGSITGTVSGTTLTGTWRVAGGGGGTLDLSIGPASDR